MPIIADSADRADILESGYVAGTRVIGTVQVEAKVGDTRLSFRQHLTIHNHGPSVIFVGPSGVTSQNGRPLYPNATMDIAVGDLGVYLIAETSNNTVVIQELS
jgi:hypothetical protein